MIQLMHAWTHCYHSTYVRISSIYFLSSQNIPVLFVLQATNTEWRPWNEASIFANVFTYN